MPRSSSHSQVGANIHPVNYILGYQVGQLMSTGINSSVNWFKPLRLGEFFGVACFSIEGIGLIFPIRSTMSNYQSFRPVFHTTASIVVFWYFVFGATGALVGSNSISIWVPKQKELFCSFMEGRFQDCTTCLNSMHWVSSFHSRCYYSQSHHRP